jgi:Fe-S-cluster containining protein
VKGPELRKFLGVTAPALYRVGFFTTGSIVSAYKCDKCPGYCCSYPVIPLNKRDVERLAAHFGLAFEDARRKFTRVDGDEPFAMRRKDDPHFGRICRFFDIQERRCTVYAARPGICRQYPGGQSCGYYDFLKSERSSQDDPAHIASTWNR